MNSRFSDFTGSMNSADSALFSAIFKVNSENSGDSAANRRTALPSDPVPAMAYVPLQFFDRIYDAEEGFSQGTIFPELNKPFTAGDAK